MSVDVVRFQVERHVLSALPTSCVFSTQGKTVSEFVAEYDSIKYPVQGHVSVDALILTRVDDYTAEIILKHAGRPIGFARRVISPHGNTMSMTLSSGEIHNVSVYEKQTQR